MRAFFQKLLPYFPLLLIILLGLGMRIFNLDWDQGHFLHPDERLYVNASNITFPQTLNELLSPSSPLNPHMFYYGEFPLFLYKAFALLVHSTDFLLSSRLLSALLSTAAIPVLYFIGKELFSKKVGFLSAFVYTFAAGSIQHAHFITTESILVLLLSLITYFSIIIFKEKKLFLLLLLGLLVGISYASKITGATFALIPFISFLLLVFQTKQYKKLLLWGIGSLGIAIISGVILAPYQLIDYKTFNDQQTYMQGVTYGQSKPPFVIIYEGTIPYLYQLTQILPFTFGFLSLPLALIGCVFLVKDYVKHSKKEFLLLFVLLFPVVYFLWSGFWYAKFSRYYILLFPFLSVWAGYLLSRVKNSFLMLLLFFIGLNGVLFLKIYVFPNTRIQGSEWIYDNVPENSTIAGEHWDDNLPLPLPNENKTYTMKQLTVYDPDSQQKVQSLSQTLSQSDYFIISSRRVYQSILNNPKEYPYTTRFYKELFDGKLGFTKVKTFTNYPFFISDDWADETFQSYDHPPVLIFRNTHSLTPQTIETLIFNTQ